MTPRDRHEQIRIFSGIESDDGVELVKTQVRRWLALNRHRLNAEQTAIVEDEISVLRAEFSGRPTRER